MVHVPVSVLVILSVGQSVQRGVVDSIHLHEFCLARLNDVNHHDDDTVLSIFVRHYERSILHRLPVPVAVSYKNNYREVPWYIHCTRYYLIIRRYVSCPSSGTANLYRYIAVPGVLYILTARSFIVHIQQNHFLCFTSDQ